MALPSILAIHPFIDSLTMSVFLDKYQNTPLFNLVAHTCSAVATGETRTLAPLLPPSVFSSYEKKQNPRWKPEEMRMGAEEPSAAGAQEITAPFLQLEVPIPQPRSPHGGRSTHGSNRGRGSGAGRASDRGRGGGAGSLANAGPISRGGGAESI